ncbi:hypothetical protein PCANC_00740 [Puccinia coronata f. sp. avenae]|uniref:Uncharacterized protein n=1 Tax=Puccinia coronata f. sp. avenae TaxID=200324 RepID=A0A2N5W6T8_9BASI|nr:hypothetical protein PCANC_00740 [Puccinia coronata f. sp. avenae]
MVTVLPACLGRQGRHVVTSRPHAVSMTEPSQVRRLSSEIVPLCISLAFWEPFSIDPTRHVGAGAPNERSVNLKLNNLRTPGCTRGVIQQNPDPEKIVWDPQRFTEHLSGAPAPTCLVESMENGSQNAREIRSQNAAKPSVIGSETNGRTALHGRAAPGPKKKPPKLNSNRTRTPIRLQH